MHIHLVKRVCAGPVFCSGANGAHHRDPRRGIHHRPLWCLLEQPETSGNVAATRRSFGNSRNRFCNWRNRAVRWGGGSDAKGAGEQPQLRNATPKHGSLSELLAEAVAGPTFGLRAAGRSSPVLAAAGPGGGHRRPGRSPMRRDRTTVRLLPLRRLAGRSGGPRHLLPQALGQGVPLTAIDTALGSDHLGPGTILVELDDRCEMFIGAAVLDCL